MPNMVITISGGLIQAIDTDSKEQIRCVILDYDVDGCVDVESIPKITDHNGNQVSCDIYMELADDSKPAKEQVKHYFNEYEKVE